jgi:hypothetical protein
MSRKMKRKSKYFRNKMNCVDYYGDAAIRTKYEYMAESFLKEAGIPYHINQVFCFTCDKFYSFESREMPSQCALCKISFKGIEKGCISRPDFILDFSDFDSSVQIRNKRSRIGILRIDGAVHDRIKATRISDYHILQSFKERGIKVFIIKNEELAEKTIKEIREMFSNIKLMMEDDNLYDKYINSKEYKSKTFCPDIQMRRYNRGKD